MPTAAETYFMLGHQTLWDVARDCHRALEKAGVPHAIVGGVAVCLHGYQRNTVDVDLLVRGDDTRLIKQALEQAGFTWSARQAEFRSPSGIAVQCVLSGERAGKGSEVVFPDPGESKAVIECEGLPVLTLAALIESKLACGQGDLRRTHKDFADVVELIAIHDLDSAYARRLHKSLRKTFRELVKHAAGG